jgi:transposase-like protein
MALSKIYTDENAARLHFEALLWPNGPTCPHCGNTDQARIAKLEGKSTRPGVYKCRECRKPFSVTVGNVFERSHIKLHQWAYATHILTAGKKRTSSLQVSRMLGITYKTAWFVTHRIREAMRALGIEILGGHGEIVEADETYLARLKIPRAAARASRGIGTPRAAR